MFAPESEETIRLAEESRSKLGDLVKSYDYTKLNNLYDLLVPQRKKSREQLYFANDVRKNIFKTPFQKQTTNLIKRIEYLPTKASMSPSMLIPLAQDTMANASLFETHLKKEMFEDLKYVQSLEKEVGDIQKEFDDFKTQIEKQNVSSRVDDILMQEVNHRTSVSRPQLMSTQIKDTVMPNNSQVMLKKKKSTCFVRDLQGNNLFLGTRGSDLYIISLQESSSPTPLCFMAKASPTQAWLWHHRLSHLNFDTINVLSKNTFVNAYKLKVCSKMLPNDVPIVDKTDTSQQELKLLFSPIYTTNNEYSTSFALFDNLQQQDTQPTMNIQHASEPIIPPTDVKAEEINNDQAEDTQFEAYEFLNPFAPPGTKVAESSSRNIDTSNMHTFYQRHHFGYHWTKDDPQEQVRGNPSKPMQTRQQLATDPEMCMFALTVSTAEPKNIKESMDDHAWMKEMQEELHQFDKLNVDLTKEFLSSRFSIKDTGEDNVILGIRIKHKSNGIVISQSYYIEKVLKKFNYFDCTSVTTPMDTNENLMPNNGQSIS
ncbi:integrase, catalytic region, zinc finger, CCHC-type containing protein [Tanacetum coccineum]